MSVGTSENLAAIYECNPIWRSLTEEERQFVVEHGVVRSYEKNEIIHSDGETSQYVNVLLSGKVRLYKEGNGQRAQIIRLLKPYDMFGYRASIADGPYNSTASALEACRVFRLKKEDFTQLIQTNGAFCYQIAQLMARALAHSELQTVNLTQKHIRGRLAESLLQLKRNYGYEQDGRTLDMLLSREDLANLSNMTTGNAIRTLSEFQQEGLVAVDGRKIQILDEESIEKISRIG